MRPANRELTQHHRNSDDIAKSISSSIRTDSAALLELRE
jgi:hypothetical protein